jgi:hypothetical protein
MEQCTDLIKIGDFFNAMCILCLQIPVIFTVSLPTMADINLSYTAESSILFA